MALAVADFSLILSRYWVCHARRLRIGPLRREMVEAESDETAVGTMISFAVTQASAEHNNALRFNRFEYLPSVASRNPLTLPLPLLSTHDT